MSSSELGRRRSATAVVGSAVLIAALAAVPVTVVACAALSIFQGMGEGSSVGQAWRAAGLTGEDWEVVPVFLVGAVALSMLTGVVSAVVWLVITNRVHDRGWAARAGAALAASAVPVLLLVMPNWPLAVAAAVSSGLFAFVAAPRVGYHRPAGELSPAS